MGSVRSLQANTKILKEEICGLVNNRGGFIIFGV
jgi:predicted HTH transcriptional regulator